MAVTVQQTLLLQPGCDLQAAPMTDWAVDADSQQGLRDAVRGSGKRQDAEGPPVPDHWAAVLPADQGSGQMKGADFALVGVQAAASDPAAPVLTRLGWLVAERLTGQQVTAKPCAIMAVTLAVPPAMLSCSAGAVTGLGGV